MSLFQCDSCGALENTSCSGGGYHLAHMLEREHEAVAASYREVLGLKPEQPLGCYCSACDPAWFDGEAYGIGPRPAGYNPKHEDYHTGKWHGDFERTFLPKGMFHMDEDGNLAHILTLDTDVDKYALPAEEDLVLPYFFRRMPDHGLPRTSNTEECEGYVKKMAMWVKAIDEAPEHLRPKDEPTRRAVLMHFATMVRRGQAEIQEHEERHQLLSQPLQSGKAKMKALAPLLAMATMGSGLHGRPRREAPEPKAPTPEERAAEAARSQAKLAKADKKRAMRAGKRVKVSAQSQQARSSD